MGMTKHYLFDPAFAAQRQQAAEAAVATFQHRLPAKRKNRVSASPCWDPLWEGAIHSAAAELNVAHVTINAGIFFERQADRDRVRERAETLWQEQHDHYAALYRR